MIRALLCGALWLFQSNALQLRRLPVPERDDPFLKRPDSEVSAVLLILSCRKTSFKIESRHYSSHYLVGHTLTGAILAV
jgi:hypothetical protein